MRLYALQRVCPLLQQRSIKSEFFINFHLYLAALKLLLLTKGSEHFIEKLAGILQNCFAVKKLFICEL